MKKTTLILVSIGAIFLAVFGFYLFSSKKKVALPQKQSGKSLEDWLQNNTGVECEIEWQGKKVKVLAKKGKMKVLGQEMPFGEETKLVNFILNDDWLYFWVEGESRGVKYALSSKETPSTPEGMTAPQKLVEQWAKMHYRCLPKKITEEKFAPPSGIEFVDLATFAQQLQQKIEESGKKATPSAPPEQTNVDENQLNQAIEKYLEEELVSPSFGGKVFCAHHLYGWEYNKTTATYYAFVWAYCQEFYPKDGTLAQGTGVSEPVRMAVEKANGEFLIVSRDEPADGSNYSASIKQMFPPQYADLAIKGEPKPDPLIDQAEAKAKKYFGL